MKSACFTGHRNIKEDTAELEKRLYIELEKSIINESILNFYNGGSIGYDLLVARVLLMLKQRYPQIKLHMVLPCCPAEQSERWTDRQKSEYFGILRSVDSCLLLSVTFKKYPHKIQKNYTNKKIRMKKFRKDTNCAKK